MDKRRIAAMLAAVSARAGQLVSALKPSLPGAAREGLLPEGRGWPPPSARCFPHASQASGQSGTIRLSRGLPCTRESA
jgi:hypothetical protein